ncbi:oligosaccharide flippase family protein [Eubacteriales bacterium OttesenSCG-928-N14]|nr:oligosaccharide flippase family protein [Eubacteriales bacterium OttesenSCG-928-N14]
MNIDTNNIKHSLKRMVSTGFFPIVISNILVKVVAFCGGMILVRILTKEDYGMYTYVLNAYNLIMITGDLGCAVAAMQFCNESFEDIAKADGFFIYGMKVSIIGSIFSSLLLLLSPVYYPFSIDKVALLTASLCLMPFINNINGFLVMNLRIKLRNRRYAFLNIFMSIINYVVMLPMAWIIGLEGSIYAIYIVGILSLAMGVFLNHKHFPSTLTAGTLQKAEKSSFLKLALSSQANNGIDHLLMLLDVFLIGLFISSSTIIASYKVSTTIPSALLFIPSSLMIYLVPYFSRKSKEIEWVKKNYKRVILYGGVFNLALSILFIALSPFIIPLIFGKQYSDAVMCFAILMIGYFFSATFRIPSSNIIYTQHKVKVNLIITISSGILNCILDIVFILYWGSVGAAIATTLVNIYNGMFSFLYMKYYFSKR